MKYFHILTIYIATFVFAPKEVRAKSRIRNALKSHQENVDSLLSELENTLQEEYASFMHNRSQFIDISQELILKETNISKAHYLTAIVYFLTTIFGMVACFTAPFEYTTRISQNFAESCLWLTLIGFFMDSFHLLYKRRVKKSLWKDYEKTRRYIEGNAAKISEIIQKINIDNTELNEDPDDVVKRLSELNNGIVDRVWPYLGFVRGLKTLYDIRVIRFIMKTSSSLVKVVWAENTGMIDIISDEICEDSIPLFRAEEMSYMGWSFLTNIAQGKFQLQAFRMLSAFIAVVVNVVTLYFAYTEIESAQEHQTLVKILKDDKDMVENLILNPEEIKKKNEQLSREILKINKTK